MAPHFVANRPARVQCASRSFAKVSIGRRFAPLLAPGKYRCLSSARFVVHRLRLPLWYRPTTFACPMPVAPNTARAVGQRSKRFCGSESLEGKNAERPRREARARYPGH